MLLIYFCFFLLKNLGLWASEEYDANVNFATAKGQIYYQVYGSAKSARANNVIIAEDYFGNGQDAYNVSFTMDLTITGPGSFTGGKHNAYAFVAPPT